MFMSKVASARPMVACMITLRRNRSVSCSPVQAAAWTRM